MTLTTDSWQLAVHMTVDHNAFNWTSLIINTPTQQAPYTGDRARCAASTAPNTRGGTRESTALVQLAPAQRAGHAHHRGPGLAARWAAVPQEHRPPLAPEALVRL